jgi:hypothetical protein
MTSSVVIDWKELIGYALFIVSEIIAVSPSRSNSIIECIKYGVISALRKKNIQDVIEESVTTRGNLVDNSTQTTTVVIPEIPNETTPLNPK